jgi:hypothetical protein
MTIRSFRFCIVSIVLPVILSACQASRTSNPVGPNNSASSSTTPERPSLVARIDNISMYPVPNHREDLAVSLVLAIGNAGTPSTVKEWTLEVTKPAQRAPTVATPVHVNGVVDMPGTSGKKVNMGTEDLALKTASTSIEKDSHVNGILTFVFPRTRESDLADNATALVLRFKDASGNSYSTTRAALAHKGKLPQAKPSP